MAHLPFGHYDGQEQEEIAKIFRTISKINRINRIIMADNIAETVLDVPRTLKQSIRAWWNYTDDDGLKSQQRMFSKLPFYKTSKEELDTVKEASRVAYTSLVDIAHPSFKDPVKINTLEIGDYPKPSNDDEIPIVCSHGYAAGAYLSVQRHTI